MEIRPGMNPGYVEGKIQVRERAPEWWKENRSIQVAQQPGVPSFKKVLNIANRFN